MVDIASVTDHGSVKVILSAGFGLGWSSIYQSDPEKQWWMLTYQPIIDAIEGRLNRLIAMDLFRKDFLLKFGQHPIEGYRPVGLEVVEVSGAFTVGEYDGAEWIELVREMRAFDQNGICKLEPSK